MEDNEFQNNEAMPEKAEKTTKRKKAKKVVKKRFLVPSIVILVLVLLGWLYFSTFETTDDAFIVGMIGRLSPQKAPDVFVRAAKLINDAIHNSAFIIVGDGEERAEVERFANENDLKLVVTGWTDEPFSFLKISFKFHLLSIIFILS